MIPRELIRKILEVATQAPSGENAQPWKFEVKDDELFVFNIPERDQSLYNFEQRGSLVSHGALIENIVIAAAHHGLVADVAILPDSSNSELIAKIGLRDGESEGEALYPYIATRTTNRKPYKKRRLTEEQLGALRATARDAKQGEVRMTTDREEIRILAEVGSLNERVMFSNRYLHGFFFDHVNWTEEEDKRKRLGFYIKTLELPLPIQKILPLFRSWRLMSLVNRLGVNTLIAKGNAKMYASSSAIGCVVVDDYSPQNMILAGRILQRIWLETTAMGMSLQPLTGVAFFMQRIAAGAVDKFSKEQVELIGGGYKKIVDTFHVDRGVIPLMFRIGDGGEPTAHALKLDPQIKYE